MITNYIDDEVEGKEENDNDDDDDDDDGFVGQCLAPGHARSPFVVD